MTTPVAPPEIREEGDLNVPLLTLTRDFLQENRPRHNQGVWFSAIVRPLFSNPGLRGPELARMIAETSRTDCNTVGCFAGWAALFAGWRQWDKYPSTVYDPSLSFLMRGEYAIKEAAQLSLGLTDDQAQALFFADNTIFDLVSMIDRLLTNQDDDLIDFYQTVKRRAEEQD
jgi:hypothetical protein